jgi:hypothetical protein
MGEGRGNGKLQDGNLHITSFPWTTNEQQIYIRLQMRILKTRSLFLILENIIVFFFFNFWLQRIV